MKASKIITILSVTQLIFMMASCSLFTPKYKNLKKENDIHTKEELLNSTLRIEMTITKKIPFIGETISTSFGSGVIFYEDNSRYYALTNNHVIFKMNGFDNPKYSVVDNKGIERKAKVEKSASSYDLAVVSFEKDDYQYNVVHINETNPVVGTYVSAIDNNFISTSGTISKYEPGQELSGTINASTNVKFDVISASTYVHPGSSGGILYDDDFNLVGIVYASCSYSTGEFICSYSIPCEKVISFLKNA
ncbi:MAG: serine protease [Bacilli bacterium]